MWYDRENESKAGFVRKWCGGAVNPAQGIWNGKHSEAERKPSRRRSGRPEKTFGKKHHAGNAGLDHARGPRILNGMELSLGLAYG